LGFYLLIGFAPDAPLGQFWQLVTGERLAFSFNALVIGSMIYSLPFVVQPLQVAFSSIPSHYLDSAASLGAKPLDQFFSVVLPLARPGIITAITLGFAHTMGEFGVVLMIGGNIPGETQVMSIALYDHVEGLAYAQAHFVSVVLLIISFFILLFTYSRNMNVLRFGFSQNEINK
jgi:molybdate transport system permease protein